MFSRITISFFLGATLFACSESDECIDESKIDGNAVCVQVYEPVCGCNGVTYSNSCEAEAAGVTSWVNGECGGDQ